MFTLLLNDIATNLQLCDMILYADDILMFHAGKTSIDIGSSLSSELDQITCWFNENNQVINLKKSETECVLCETHQKTLRASAFEVKLNGMKIIISTVYNYLGL